MAENKENKWYEPIPDGVKKAGISSLANRPNQPSTYGDGGLSAKALKERFDKLALSLIDKLNALLEAVNNGDFSNVAKIDTGIDDIQTLSALIGAMKDGTLANKLLKVGMTNPNFLETVINGIQSSLDEIKETRAVRLEMHLDDSDYTLRVRLVSNKGEMLGDEQSVNFPSEFAFVKAELKGDEIIFTLQNGNTVSVPVSEIAKFNIVQETGYSEKAVMSQKATTGAIKDATEYDETEVRDITNTLTIESGRLDFSGAVNSAAGAHTTPFGVAEGEKYIVTSRYGYACPLIVEYGAEGNAIGYVGENAGGTVGAVDYEYIVPSGVEKIAVSHVNGNTIVVKKEFRKTLKEKVAELDAQIGENGDGDGDGDTENIDSVARYDDGVIVMPAPSGWTLGALNGYGEVLAHTRRMVSDLFEVYRGYKWEIVAPEGYFVTVAFYDENCNCTGVDAEYEGQYFFFDEIKGAKYIRIQLKKTDDTAIEDLTVGNQVIIKANSKANKVAETVKQITTRGKNLYNHAKSYYSNRGNGTGAASLKILNSEWIELEPNSKYRLTYWSDVDANAAVVYTIIDGEGNETTSGAGIYVSKTSAVEITTGEGTHLFRFSPYSAENNYVMERMMLEKVTTPVLPTEFEPYKETVDFAKLLPTALWNPWIGKKMVVDGDSITHAVGREKWQFHAANALGMWLDTTIDAQTIAGSGWRGEGGSTIAVEANNPMYDIVSRWQNYPADADIVLIAGGSNDWAHNKINIGDFDSTDNTTFNGALNALLPALKNKYPTTPVVMMTPIRRGTPGATNKLGYKLEDFVNAMIAKCRQYNIYCLDMWATCPIDPSTPSMYEALFLPGDNTHPNEEGQKVMGRTVAGFIRTLS